VRVQGLAVDALREVELVTAGGDVLTVNADSHPDLFWALRGGGGNFGVVTRFTFQAIPADGLVGGHVMFDTSDVPAVIRAWRDIMRDGPDELNSSLMLMPPFAPEIPSGPQLAIALRGSEDELRGLLAPLLSLPSVSSVSLGPTTLGDLLEDAPPGKPPFDFVGGNGFVPELTDEAIDVIAAQFAREVPTMVLLRALGGAFSRVAPDATAIAYRDAEALLIVNAIVAPDAPPEQVAALREGSDAALAFTRGAYGGFSTERSDDVTRSLYPPATFERLRHVKAQVDPGNAFRQNHNIPPAD
jgi:hypothetical protein